MQMTHTLCRRARLWAAVSCVLLVYVVLVVRLHPLNFFGLFHDDSIYFSAAQALANGHGYILPNLPGSPPATKYPILYSYILSWVWRMNPSFPANLSAAIAITVAFALAFVVFSFVLIRRMNGFSSVEALLLTALIAFHPAIIMYGSFVLSDIPFAAVAVAIMVMAEDNMRPEGGTMAVMGCAILAGFSMLLRIFGVPIVAGIVAAGLFRRSWRQLAVFCACVTPFLVTVAWRWILPATLVLPVSPTAASTPGWVHTWTYDTSYLSAWRIGVPDVRAFWVMLVNNLATLVSAPASFFLDPLMMNNTPGGVATTAVVSAIILAGIVRQACRYGFKVIHFVLPFYIGVTLLWNYPFGTRFFILFLPLFAAGLCFESKHIFAMVHLSFCRGRPITQKLIGAVLGLMLFALVGGIALIYVGPMRAGVVQLGKNRAEQLEDLRGAYDWISHNSPPSARLIAFEDANLYLHTGRQAMVPIQFTTAEFYEPERLADAVRHMMDVPCAVGARYWLFTDDDYKTEWTDAARAAHTQMAKIENALPLVYRSADGRVRIGALGCLQHQGEPVCLPGVLSCSGFCEGGNE